MTLKITFKTIFICSLGWILFSCSRSQENEYIGYWVEDNIKITEPIEIMKEGDKLFLKAENMDIPANYNKEDKSLTVPISYGIATVEMILNIIDSDHLKMTLNNKSHSMSRVSKKEAEKKLKDFYAYKNPDFFIGEWIRENQNGSIKIIKEGGNFFFLTESKEKKRLFYNKEDNELFFYPDPLFRYSIRHSGDSDIIAFGKIYKRK